MGDLYTIRLADSKDIPAIVATERVSFSDPWPASTFASLLGRYAAVVQCDSEIAAYVFGRRTAEQGEILNLAVGPAHRQRGLATRLVGWALDSFGEVGVGAVFLEVRESNLAARRLYRSLGFREVGRRRGYYSRPREDAVVMKHD